MESSKLYVGNIPYSTTADDLRDLFTQHGTVKEARVIEGRGFGFVEMETVEEAENAKETLNNTEFQGRTLKIDEARPRNNNRNNNRRKYRRYWFYFNR